MTCRCCGSATTPTRYAAELGGGALVVCSSCEHVQVSSLPSPDELERYYGNKYSAQRSAYVDDKYLAVMAKRAVAQCDFIERAGVSLTGARVADIGCGYGALVQELTKRGAHAVGYEYDPACVDYCTKQGLSVTRIHSEDDLAGLGAQDLVTLSHTLEHMRDVDAALGRLRQAHIFIEVPRYDFALAAQFADQEGHLHFFNPLSLRRLLERTRLPPKALVACGPSLRMYWRAQLAPVRRVWRTVSRDWFLNAYGTERVSGMWIRAITSPS